MIGNDCILWSSFFILTVNFKAIESTNKIAPSYYVSQTISYSFVNTVNNLKTYNEPEIKFNEKEITTLTTPAHTYNDNKNRELLFDKFDKKIEDVKCTCSLIVKTKLAYLSNILEGLESGGAIEVAKDKLTKLKEEAGLMILLFHKGNVKAGKWFWSYYFKIMAILEHESNKHFFGETPFEEEELQNGITDFLQYCKNKKYLPKNRTESDLVSKNSNLQTNIFKKIRSSVIIAVDYFHVMQYISIEYLYLKPLWDEHEFLFGEIAGSIVEWRPTIRRHAVEVDKTKKYVENRQWIPKPFGHLSYHKLIKQIISVRVYTFLWVMLVIFNKEMPKMDLLSLNLMYVETKQTIVTVQRCMHYTETLFFDIIAELRCAMNDNQKNFDSIISRISVRVKDILVELNGDVSNDSEWISVNINDEYTYAMISEFLKDFSDNMYSTLVEKYTKFNYKLALSILVEGN
ncbi:uncharacterized protein LOC126842213 [Adelges cooleyi]|uniref:uncharacterized protein LOC126842213 n=1 Tax=Adelges cooleyi TaxID=133065 RepID=UPI00217F42D2|nr:uncharacterized protein LOC126842213 [Adelges cooleyi]